MIQTLTFEALSQPRRTPRPVPRSLTDVSAAIAVAQDLIADVRSESEVAPDQAERLDGVRPAPRVRLEADRLRPPSAPLMCASVRDAFARGRPSCACVRSESSLPVLMVTTFAGRRSSSVGVRWPGSASRRAEAAKPSLHP
jgi:hypothetical protein